MNQKVTQILFIGLASSFAANAHAQSEDHSKHDKHSKHAHEAPAESKDAVKCSVCGMKVDTKHKVHFRYEVDGTQTEIGSLSCAKKFWTENKAKKLSFRGRDFISGEWIDPSKGFLLLNSKLNVGTKMDKGTSAVLFANREMADKAQRVNGGVVLTLRQALSRL